MKTNVTPAEYLAWERQQATKHELVNGVIVPKYGKFENGEIVAAGASRKHNQISRNINGLLFIAFRGRECEAFQSNMRVRANEEQYRYPDIVAACGAMDFEDSDVDTLLNPQVIIEVLSPSTAAKDGREKFREYERIESLTDYILIRQQSMRVHHFSRRSATDWTIRIYTRPEDAVPISSVDVTLTLADIYEKVQFETLALNETAAGE